MTRPVHIVWFKRDLRTIDHAPLEEAARTGEPVLPLYVAEPSVLQAPDFAPRHWEFIATSLRALDQQLTALGQPLVFKDAVEVIPVFETIRQTLGIAGIYAHEETGNAITYARDRDVIRWTRAHNIPFREFPANGVIRRLRTREGWARKWEARMSKPLIERPSKLIPLPQPFDSDPLANAGDHAGGEGNAHRTLESFLDTRGHRYHREMSSPVTAFDSCSRLSAHPRLRNHLYQNDRARNSSQAREDAGHGNLQSAACVRRPSPLAVPLHAETRRRTGHRVPQLRPLPRRLAR